MRNGLVFGIGTLTRGVRILVRTECAWHIVLCDSHLARWVLLGSQAHIMSTTCDKTGVIESEYLMAAKRLLDEVMCDSAKMIDDTNRVCAAADSWKAVFDGFRSEEEKTMVKGTPSAEKTAAYLSSLNAMIIYAGVFRDYCERHLETSDQIDDEYRAALKSRIDMIKRHREILAFDFASWTPLSKELAEKGERELFGDSGRKAA
jgi:hypothetical protein